MSENPVTSDSNRTNGKAGAIKLWAFQVKQKEIAPVAILRCWLRVLFIMIHEFSATAISLRASALTYTIVLSMVPMLAMSTALLKGMGRDNQLRIAAYKLLDQLEPGKPQPIKDSVESRQSPAMNLDTQEPGSTNQALKQNLSQQRENSITQDQTAAQVSQSQSMTTHLRNAVDNIFDYVDRTNFAAIGAFGIIGLLLTVILVLSTIEDAMNAIWHSRKGRSVFRKIMDYLALLILLPVTINVALAGDAALKSPRIMAYFHTVIPSEWAIKMLLTLLPFLFVILSLMIMYLFFPTVKVKTYAALSGAVFAGFFWFLAQKIYIVMQIGVARYNAIYGSFATVPLFLIWVQIGWTFILLGASLAYAVQNRKQYHLPGAGGSPQRNLQLAFDITNTVFTNFEKKQMTTFEELIQENPGVQPGDLLEITEKLARGGLLHQVEDNNRSYVPSAPAETIEAKDVVRIILGHEKIPTMGGDFSGKVILAAESAIPREAFPVLVHSVSDPEDTPAESILDEVIDAENDEKTL